MFSGPIPPLHPPSGIGGEGRGPRDPAGGELSAGRDLSRPQAGPHGTQPVCMPFPQNHTATCSFITGRVGQRCAGERLCQPL